MNRRRVERIHLGDPLPARIGGQKVFIMDVSLRGLRIAHQKPIGVIGTTCTVDFDWQGETGHALCKIVRTSTHRTGVGLFRRTVHHSGVTIEPPIPAPLQSLVEWHVTRALDEQKANAHGVPPFGARSVQTGGGGNYVRHELIGGLWRELPTSDPKQPRHGFTVSSQHSAAEVAMLRSAFEQGDISSREMLQKMAQLSISNIEGIPTRKYTP